MNWKDFKNNIRSQYENGVLDVIPVDIDDINFDHVYFDLDVPFDISQGSGNVLVYTIFDANEMTAYKYADC